MTIDSNICPDPETMAAFLDGRLPEHDRKQMAAHLAGCERCYFIFTEAVQSPATQQATGNDESWTRRRVVWSAAATLVAAAALVLAVRSGIGPASSDEQLQTLVSAVGTDRVIEPRLSGGFAYGPLRTVRSSPATALSLSPDLRIAAARVEKATESQESPEALRARGIACVLIGNVDCATTALQLATSQRPNDASMLNDLAAAYLVRAERSGDQNDASRALATANRALEIDRLSPEARFNRAAALEHLGMRAEARDAWQAYLTIDDRSGWADEARARLQALTREP
jgi:tetratricopeptide (TPR) repeat protein